MDTVRKQPYIGRQVSHFEKVDVENIKALFSDDQKYRYTLSIPFYKEQERTKTVTVILKNPSSADAQRADKTVQNVEKVIYKAFGDASKVEILNLFALRGTYPKEIMEAYTLGVNIVGDNNDAAFEEVLHESDYIVVAWGGASPIRSSLYDARIGEVLNRMKRIEPFKKVFRKKEKGSQLYPFHACYWPDTVDFIHY